MTQQNLLQKRIIEVTDDKEKIESNDNDAKDNNDPKKLTEDAESESEVVDKVKTETESENDATKPVTEKDNEVTDDKETKTDNNEDEEKIRISEEFCDYNCKTHKRKRRNESQIHVQISQAI